MNGFSKTTQLKSGGIIFLSSLPIPSTWKAFHLIDRFTVGVRDTIQFNSSLGLTQDLYTCDQWMVKWNAFVPPQYCVCFLIIVRSLDSDECLASPQCQWISDFHFCRVLCINAVFLKLPKADDFCSVSLKEKAWVGTEFTMAS